MSYFVEYQYSVEHFVYLGIVFTGLEFFLIFFLIKQIHEKLINFV